MNSLTLSVITLATIMANVAGGPWQYNLNWGEPEYLASNSSAGGKAYWKFAATYQCDVSVGLAGWSWAWPPSLKQNCTDYCSSYHPSAMIIAFTYYNPVDGGRCNCHTGCSAQMPLRSYTSYEIYMRANGSGTGL